MKKNHSKFITTLNKKVLLCDGGTGTLYQSQALDLKTDLLDKENCFEVLNLTRPDIVESIHRQYLEAGADCIETNSFGANKVVLHEFDLIDKVYEINLKAAKIARKIADEYSTEKQPRFVIGSMGPGTKLPSLGQVTYDELVDSYAEQARGLLDGHVDCFLLETNQDLLTIKAEIHACKLIRKGKNKNEIPIFAQVTMDVTGKMLVGSDIATVVTALQAMDIDGIGLNCGLGPVEMAEHVRYLSRCWEGFISVMPNAGLPMMVDGQTHYPLTPEELAIWHERFVNHDGVNFIGGCCGTTPAHIKAVREMLDAREHQAPQPRTPKKNPAASSLFQSVSFQQEHSVFSIGERANANGSKKFRTLLEVENWDGMLAIAKEQAREGSNAIDISVACVGRDEKRDMNYFLSLCRGQVSAPLVVDSTNADVIHEGLKLLGGKSIVNSINLESGEEKAREVLKLAKQFGAAVIALTIDEHGMAKTVEQKIKIAKRLYQLAINEFQLPASDLFFDPLTFTICTGMDDDREHAIHTLEAISEVQKACPGAQILLGLSNVSFGLKSVARQVLNSVFLHHAIERGLVAAIMHGSKIKPMHQISDEERKAADHLIFNQWENDQDPLLSLIKLFEHQKEESVKIEILSIEEKLKHHILNGDKLNLKEDLNEALKQYLPAVIINEHLLPAMQIVGEYFGRGEMQLPFVLQSAETMKAAVKILEPLMKQETQAHQGTLVLATVKGDVHDIGKNLVEIILSNNGFKVIDIGIKQSLEEILDAAKKHHADAIGMSGLLVQSAMIMKENLVAMHEQGIQLPVILGGAALTEKFVKEDCQRAYNKGKVYYAKDAFSALDAMKKIIAAR